MKTIPVLGIIPGEDLTDRKYCIIYAREILEDIIIAQESFEANEDFLRHYLISENEYDQVLKEYERTKSREYVKLFAEEKILTNTFIDIPDSQYDEAVKKYKIAIKDYSITKNRNIIDQPIVI